MQARKHMAHRRRRPRNRKAPSSNRLAQRGRHPVTHDAAGNILDDGVRQYRYDAAGRLSAIHRHGIPLASYRHDHRGLRRQKTVFGLTIHYHYDPQGRLLNEQGGPDPTARRHYL
ncbi:MAG: hypothetical protein AB1522_16755, partial [Chloroflexota bacterium]